VSINLQKQTVKLARTKYLPWYLVCSFRSQNTTLFK